MGNENEPVNENLPPCLRVCGPEHKLRVMTLLSVPCDLLKRMGACRPDNLCEKDQITRPVAYYKTKVTGRFRRDGKDDEQGRD